MAAALNGMTLYGGLIPYGGTFLIFSDYMRPALRIAALSHVPSIFVFTHDSVGLGEDGPTHQPIEHLAALRAMPNMLLIRPADANEVVEAWKIAIARRRRPHGAGAHAAERPGLRSVGRPDPAEGLAQRRLRAGVFRQTELPISF